eukprot:TRINITY_DN2836_c1_g1_i1.p1 TRINITY_DN2836_c1_g1~~TRINITY_DN2836_c1_g1_i1.p1  ORF type:complete len:1203 (+),score=190.05 TRINITY_DN2836_c1_g1_i1:45-3653(+)
MSKRWSEEDVDRLRAGFREIDKDKNGLIDKNDLKELLKRHFGEHCDDDEVEEYMPVLGADDTVVFEDYVHYLTTDTSLRFDVKFIRYMRQKWEDHLGLQVYLPFLCFFVFFLLHGKGLGSGYWVTFSLNDKVMGEEFELSEDLRFEKFYKDIANTEEYWEWAKGPLMGAWWQGEDADAANEFVQFANMPVGAMKIRQMRVAPSACSSREDILKNAYNSLNPTKAALRLQDFPYDCYSDWGPATPSDKQPYAITVTNSTTDIFSASTQRTYLESSMIDQEARDLVSEAFFWRPCSGVNGINASLTMVLEGKAATYGCSGYALIIPFSWPAEKVSKALGFLESGVSVTHDNNTFNLPWVDNQTRALSVEMFTFNQNLQLFSRIQYLVEVTAGGSYIPIYSNINFRLFQWSTDPFVIHFFMFVFFTSLVFYFASWCMELWRNTTDFMVDRRRRGFFARVTSLFITFFSSFWTIFDFMNYVFFFTVWGLRFVSLGFGKTNNPVLQNDWYPDEYETVARSTQIISYLDSINGLLCVGRIFYFLRLDNRFNVLTKTIEVALYELAGLLFIFFVVFLGFCLMGFTVFGHVVEDYRDIGSVIGTLLRYLVGDFDYEQIREERRIFAPIFFVLFTALCFFLLFNMFIAVLSDAFAKVQEEKYKPALLDSLLKNTDDDAYEPLESQTGNFFTDLAIVREIMYWIKTLLLAAQNLIRRGPEWDARYKETLERTRSENPRLYWQTREREMVDRKSCTAFVDKLNLCPISLEGFLIDGDDNADEDDNAFQGFGNDFNTVMQTLVDEPSDKMERERQDTLLELLESHYYWNQEVRGIAQVGQTLVDYDDDPRVYILREIAISKMNDSDNGSMTASSSHTEEDDNEQELKDEQEVAAHAVIRKEEQKRVMKDVIARVSSITSNKKSLEQVINRAAATALKSRMVRRKVIARFEQGTPCKIRAHQLIGARYGRYITDVLQIPQQSKKILLSNGKDTTEWVTITQGTSEEEYLSELRFNFDISEGKECIVKHSISGEIVHLYYELVIEKETYIVTEGPGEAPNWQDGEWSRAPDGSLLPTQGPKTGVWNCTVPDHIVFANIQKIMDQHNGLLKLASVEDAIIAGGRDIDNEMLSEPTCSESTVHEYPLDHIEEVGCYNQLELIYEPTTIFREHLESKLIQLIRKRLPTLMLETLSTQQLMTLLEVKVRRAEEPVNAPTE